MNLRKDHSCNFKNNIICCVFYTHIYYYKKTFVNRNDLVEKAGITNSLTGCVLYIHLYIYTLNYFYIMF